MEHHELWQAVLAKIEPDLSRPNFLTWFHETAIMAVENGVATVCVPNMFVKEWLQNKFHKAILHTLRSVSPEVKEVAYIIKKQDSPSLLKDDVSGKKKPSSAQGAPHFTKEMLTIKDLTVDPATNLNPRYTFHSFVVGSFNELAFAAAQSVIKNLGCAYNPLFIYGGVGLGKTHLIQGIGNETRKSSPHLKIRYVASEKYMGEIVDALRNQEMNRLKEKYRDVDLLIMDDIQFIAKTEKMQEEFFHAFNALYEKNKQIIISSDRPPHAIATLEERLRSRFEGGMIADIGLPDFETRLLILKAKTEEKKIVIEDQILQHLADKIKTNVRELEGTLNRIIIAAQVSQAPLTLEYVKKVVSHHLNAPKKYVSVKKILKTVADFYEINEHDLMHRSRKKDVVKPRQIAMYLMRDELKLSYPSIGDRFGGRDHTTAIHSCEKIVHDLTINPELEDEIRMIKDRIFSE